MAYTAALGYWPYTKSKWAYNFLHDGRARSLLEAVMWHGSEAEAIKNKVKGMSSSERNAQIKFLESL